MSGTSIMDYNKERRFPNYLYENKIPESLR